MKHSRLLAASVATAALALTPAAAFGYSQPGSGNIIVEDQTPEECTFPVSVAIEATTLQVTLTVKDSSGATVYEVTKFNDGSNSVDFNVNLGAGCDGTYSLVAIDELGQVLATASVEADNGNTGGGSPANPAPGNGGGVAAGGGTTDNNVGGLPATGSSDAMLVSGLAGAGLLAGGSVLLVRRRRAAA